MSESVRLGSGEKVYFDAFRMIKDEENEDELEVVPPGEVSLSSTKRSYLIARLRIVSLIEFLN